MLTASVLLPFCNFLHDATNLRNCLDTLDKQTQPAEQIILADDSHPDDRAEVRAICDQHGALYLEFPFVQYAPAFARKFNRSFARATGDAVVLLCSNWLLGPDWIAEMTKWLQELGPRSIVASDNMRHKQNVPERGSVDWFAGYPDRFEVTDHNLIDEGFLTMLYRKDWLPWDESFDPTPGDESEQKGNWHGVIEWGWRLMTKEHMRLWIRRDLKAEHQESGNRPVWFDQIDSSAALLTQKGVP